MTEKELVEKGIPYVIVCSDGKQEVYPLEPHSKTTIITHQGKVDRIESNVSMKFKGR
ncbi:XtrA/YqaO family protein [Jeotgalibacillus haloalkalitolerans]|uniref:XtrA/YqaO family protein n=1 Tax=Jeotgalibacillus haloalkalitolerans TaxID=3104292 RepID=A0ABU5KK47_9BACL|nr:XtrA/YqaO family protein [Jeotgalibacillus sp. HH7-29]MDZ5711642.1 XtrA/YqaO family protein [Jeotgalibacillus sp. HH7-29]